MLSDIRFLWRDQPKASRWGAVTVTIWLLSMVRAFVMFVDGQTMHAAIFGGVLVLIGIPLFILGNAALSVARSRRLGDATTNNQRD